MMRQFTSPLDCWRLASRKASWSLNPVVSLEVRGGDFPGGLQTSAVAQLCPILYNLMDCSLPGSSIHGIFQARKSTGVGCHCLFQGIFPTQGSNPGLPHYRQMLYHLSHQGGPAAAAEWLQSCPTLCDPRDGSPPGSPVPGILQARTLEWVAISFSSA